MWNFKTSKRFKISVLRIAYFVMFFTQHAIRNTNRISGGSLDSLLHEV